MAFARHCLAALAAAVMVAASVPAQASVSESDVEAAFLPRFARYVIWPPAARPNGADPFVLCVIGSDPFGDGLDSAARSQSVDGRRIIVRRMDSTANAAQCHIAFVGGSRVQSIGQMLAALRGKPILTVTDSHSGDARGIVDFSVVGGRVRFFIDNSDASSRGLNISSRLLALAIDVKQR